MVWESAPRGVRGPDDKWLPLAAASLALAFVALPVATTLFVTLFAGALSAAEATTHLVLYFAPPPVVAPLLGALALIGGVLLARSAAPLLGALALIGGVLLARSAAPLGGATRTL